MTSRKTLSPQQDLIDPKQYSNLYKIYLEKSQEWYRFLGICISIEPGPSDVIVNLLMTRGLFSRRPKGGLLVQPSHLTWPWEWMRGYDSVTVIGRLQHQSEGPRASDLKVLLVCLCGFGLNVVGWTWRFTWNPGSLYKIRRSCQKSLDRL